MQDVLVKIWECKKYDKMLDFPHNSRTVDTYADVSHVAVVYCVQAVHEPHTAKTCLVQFEGHPHPGGDHPPQHLHVVKHPLVSLGRDTEVTLEQGV